MKRYLYLLATDQVKGGFTAVLKVILWVISQIYGLMIAVRGIFYKLGICKIHKLPSPVISVGNLTMGGVGKTPLVVFLARQDNQSAS